MPAVVAAKAVEFFMPLAARDFLVGFYGGEPLLAFDLIRTSVERTRALARAAGRRPRFTLTTNGSLLTEDILGFLEANRFSLVLSYDGAAQDDQRAPGSGRFLRDHIRRIVKKNRIRLEVNAVFTARNVSNLAATVSELDDLNVPRVRYGLSSLEAWSDRARRRLMAEIENVGRWTKERRRLGTPMVLVNLQENLEKRAFSCSAGLDRLAVDAQGRIWGCPLFSDFFRKTNAARIKERYCFGSILRLETRPENWDTRYGRIFPNYSRLNTDGPRTSSGPCFLCSLRAFCRICPVNAALSGGRLDLVPERLCRLNKTKIAAGRKTAPAPA